MLVNVKCRSVVEDFNLSTLNCKLIDKEIELNNIHLMHRNELLALKSIQVFESSRFDVQSDQIENLLKIIASKTDENSYLKRDFATRLLDCEYDKIQYSNEAEILQNQVAMLESKLKVKNLVSFDTDIQFNIIDELKTDVAFKNNEINRLKYQCFQVDSEHFFDKQFVDETIKGLNICLDNEIAQVEHVFYAMPHNLNHQLQSLQETECDEIEPKTLNEPGISLISILESKLQNYISKNKIIIEVLKKLSNKSQKNEFESSLKVYQHFLAETKRDRVNLSELSMNGIVPDVIQDIEKDVETSWKLSDEHLPSMDVIVPDVTDIEKGLKTSCELSEILLNLDSIVPDVFDDIEKGVWKLPHEHCFPTLNNILILSDDEIGNEPGFTPVYLNVDVNVGSFPEVDDESAFIPVEIEECHVESDEDEDEWIRIDDEL
jgi:hypothetical protein